MKKIILSLIAGAFVTAQADCPTYVGRPETYTVGTIVSYNGNNFKVIRDPGNGWTSPDNTWFWETTSETCDATGSTSSSSNTSDILTKLQQILDNQNNSVIDPRDGQVYGTVKIGNQVWMNRNIAYRALNYKCDQYSSVTCAPYGALYSFYDAKNACPVGWHVPSAAEWDTLFNAAGGRPSAGTMLKAKTGFISDDINGHDFNGVDMYGFNALPNAVYNGKYFNEKKSSQWWTTTEGVNNFATCAFTDEMRPGPASTSCLAGKDMMFAVRCLKD